MDISTIIMIVAGLAVLYCIVGMVRNWNKPSEIIGDGGPQVHITLVGWLFALLGAGVAIALLILAWNAGWLPPWMLRGGGRWLVVITGTLIGLGVFYVGAGLCHLVGLRAWVSLQRSSDSKPPRQLRYRLEDQECEPK